MQLYRRCGIYSPIQKRREMIFVKTVYLPEGSLLGRADNADACATLEGLRRARDTRRVLEGMAVSCDPNRNLIVRLGPFLGVIPRDETAVGIAQGQTREIAILSRVGRPVSFLVTGFEELPDGGVRPILSRCQAQALALEHLFSTVRPGHIIPAAVTHLEPFGAFVDIGCGVPSMIGIESISISRLPHPSCRFQMGQRIYAVVTGLEPDKNRVTLSHKELLGTWEENAALFTPGMTVPGYIRGVKDYGLFVELLPNLSGLAEPKVGYTEGERVSVYIKSIQKQQMKIKLLLIDHLEALNTPEPLTYFRTEGTLERWRYAPESCTKPTAETVFG